MTLTPLSIKVIKRCDDDKLPESHELRELVDNFEKYSTALDNSYSVKKMLGSWAALKLKWREYSGEDLV